MSKLQVKDARSELGGNRLPGPTDIVRARGVNVRRNEKTLLPHFAFRALRSVYVPANNTRPKRQPSCSA